MKKINLSIKFKSKLKRWVRKHPEKVYELIEKLLLFQSDTNQPSLKTHKLTGDLDGLYSFSIEDDCRIVFEYYDSTTIALIDIGTHDEVY
jgi:mRNA interferase YafQ